MKSMLAVVLVISIILFSSTPLFAYGMQGVAYVKADGLSANTKNKVNSSNQAAHIVKSSVGGKVLKVKNNGRSGYKVKVMKDNGHIINVTVDAKSGKVR